MPIPDGHPNKSYIGDSVYIQQGSFHGEVILTTENGLPDDPSNRIGLEPSVIDQLIRYLQTHGIMKGGSE